MTVRYDPAAPWGRPPARKDQIGLIRTREYVEGRWGGVNLGIFADRAIRTGSAPSLHRDGRAWDWEQRVRAVMDEATAWATAYAEPCQFQLVIDYDRSESWRWPGPWRPYRGFGSRLWAQEEGAPWWLRTWHIERNWQGALDPRPIAEIIGEDDVTPEDKREIALLTAEAVAKLAAEPGTTLNRALVVAARDAIGEEFKQDKSSAWAVLDWCRRIGKKVGA